MDKDTPLIPEIVADGLTQDREESARLGARAREMWATSAEFRKSFDEGDPRDVMRSWFMTWMMEYHTHLTVILLEEESPFPPEYPEPLIYDLEFNHRFEEGDGIFGVASVYREEILRKAAEARYDDIVDISPAAADRPYEEVVEEIADGLRLLFAFEGPCELVMDWRDA
jgi:hypothetical protein